MALTFHPGPGAIVICDFSTGFGAPEMVKVRPVVVISPRRRTGQLATVVPLSSKEPERREPWHYPLRDGTYPPARSRMWVKADLVASVALDRLDRIMVRVGGQRTYQVFQLDADELRNVHLAVKAALSLP